MLQCCNLFAMLQFVCYPLFAMLQAGAEGGSANWLAHSALLWVQEALAQAPCQTSLALIRLLPPLLYPTLRLLLPDQSRPPSPLIALELLSLWTELLQPLSAARLLPSAPPAASGQSFVTQRGEARQPTHDELRAALGVMLAGVVGFVLQAVLAVLNEGAWMQLLKPDAGCQDAHTLQVLKDMDALREADCSVLPPLKPSSKQTWCWRLRSLLGTFPEMPGSLLEWVVQPLWEGCGKHGRQSLPQMPLPGDVRFKLREKRWPRQERGHFEVGNQAASPPLPPDAPAWQHPVQGKHWETASGTSCGFGAAGCTPWRVGKAF
ncbi:hypothetical protein DUNSADRAFT_4003 [Dunaliella salina]|uniref:Uncharacterized protein n=1 Tax=Dunaliella salina TaxID=3046 RepID=A0ABQ7GSY7_DUNSA|nr:hypothetical protein DUNSADRAFT_4003 [Dunaliella salina]|eukprot:KAF5837693.1 hypothetical protein DUNSADRAFT_4003 [Dunaliella salina]